MEKQNYTREEVIEVIEQLIEMPNVLIDKIINESPHDAENLLLAVEKYLAQSK